MGYTWLPPLLNRIADVAGMDAALRVAELRGGSQVYIPPKAAPDHWLTQAVGPEAAQHICDLFTEGLAGCHITIPVGPHSGANRTRAQVDEMLRQGISANEIARTAQVHRTTVFRRKLALRPDERQPDLFGDD